MRDDFGHEAERDLVVRAIRNQFLKPKWVSQLPHNMDNGERLQIEADNRTLASFHRNQQGDKIEYVRLQSESAKRAVGYALFGIYAILASTLYRDPIEGGGEAADSPTRFKTAVSILHEGPSSVKADDPAKFINIRTERRAMVCCVLQVYGH